LARFNEMYKQTDLKAKLAAKNVAAVDLAGKRVLIRTCLNVAMDDRGNITDATRIDESVPTLSLLGQRAARVVMMAHLGRPTTARESEFSLEKVRQELESRLGQSVQMISTIEDIKALADGSLSISASQKFFLVENIRYFAGEESSDKVQRAEFAELLSTLGDIFINDAFADYREAASTYDVAKYLPSYLGPVFIREVKAVSYFTQPERPFTAVLGGAKLSEKLDALKALASLADKVLIGGAMAYTLMLAQGVAVGNSKVETDKLDVAKAILDQYRDKIVLPVDHIVVDEFSSSAATEVVSAAEIPAGKIAVDTGPKTQELFKAHISQAKSILWNGPMGVFEWDSADAGTKAVGASIATADAYKFAGGGDSIAAINKFKLSGFNHISTGGGAMLAFVSYEHFPTLDVVLEGEI
jgi:phosphoglycerate kinase